MEDLVANFDEVLVMGEVGSLYITNIRVFWLLSNSLSNVNPNRGTGGPSSVLNNYQFLIRDWLKSEKSNKTPRVRLNFSSPPNQLVLEFKNGRSPMEEFCQILQHSNHTLKSSSTPNKIISAHSLSAQKQLTHSELLDITLTQHPSASAQASQSPTNVLNTSVTEPNAPFGILSASAYNQPTKDVPAQVPHPSPHLSSTPVIQTYKFSNANQSATHQPSSSPDSSSDTGDISSTKPRDDRQVSAHSPSPIHDQGKPKTLLSTRPGINSKQLIDTSQSNDSNLIETYKSILNNNPQLASMYEYLVGDPNDPTLSTQVQQILSPVDFWNIHSQELAASLILPSGKKNTEGFLSYPPTFEVFQGSTTVLHGNSDMMQTILLEDENINAIYSKTVKTGKMTAEAFWERFFQTKYFYQFVGKPITNTQHYITEINGHNLEAHMQVNNADAKQMTPLTSNLVEIITSDANRKRGFGTADGFSSYAGDISDNPTKLLKSNFSSLLSRFNAQSSKLVNLIDHVPISSSTNPIDHVDERNEKVSKELEMEDLLKVQSVEYPLLSLTRQQLYSSGKQDSFSSTPSENPHTPVENNLASELLRKQIKDHSSIGKLNFIENMHETGRHMFIFNTKLCQTEKIAQVASLDYDSQTVTSVKAHQNQVIELLKHFYNSKVPEEQKRAKIMVALEETKNELLSAQENLFNRLYAGGSAKALYAPIIEMIDIARNNDSRIKHTITELRAKMKAYKMRKH